MATEAWLARQEDETAHLFGAMAAFAGSMHQVLTETKAREQRVEGLLKEVNKPPITATEIQALNRAAAKNAVGEVVYAVKALTRQNYWKLSEVGGLALVVYGLVSGSGGFAAGWRWTSDRDRTENNAAKHMTMAAHDALPAMPAQDLAKCIDLIRLNPNIADRFERCHPLPEPNGGSACNLPVWTLPPQPKMAMPGTH